LAALYCNPEKEWIRKSHSNKKLPVKDRT